jgi:hypothetical protein
MRRACVTRGAAPSESSVPTRAAAITDCCRRENCIVIWISGSTTRAT